MVVVISSFLLLLYAISNHTETTVCCDWDMCRHNVNGSCNCKVITLVIGEGDQTERMVCDSFEFNEQTCRECGCGWTSPCEGGCYWVEPDLCSSCAEKEKDAVKAPKQ